jgi:hypothetical protein
MLLLLLPLLLLQRFMAQYGFVPAGGNVADRVGFDVPERWVCCCCCCIWQLLQ